MQCFGAPLLRVLSSHFICWWHDYYREWSYRYCISEATSSIWVWNEGFEFSKLLSWHWGCLFLLRLSSVVSTEVYWWSSRSRRIEWSCYFYIFFHTCGTSSQTQTWWWYFYTATYVVQGADSLIYFFATRPDISQVVYVLSQFVSDPTSVHYAVLLHVLCYFQSTISRSLLYSSDSSLSLWTYSNAKWANDHDTCLSTTGFYILQGFSIISWHSIMILSLIRASRLNFVLWLILP